MLKSLFRLVLITILGILIYDVSQSGNFHKSRTFKYLESSGALKHLEFLLLESKKLSEKGMKWAESNIPVYYNNTCIYMKPYINLSYDLGLIFRNLIISIIGNLTKYLEQNFPELQNRAAILVSDSVVLAKEGAVIVSNYVSDLVSNIGKYANEMLKS